MLKIDVFNHVLPEQFLKALPETVPARSVQTGVRKAIVWRLLATCRHEVPDSWTDSTDTCRSFVWPRPPVEDVGDGNTACELARIANDSMAEMVGRYPDRFDCGGCLSANE